MKKFIGILLITCLFVVGSGSFETISSDSYKASIGLNMFTSLQDAVNYAGDGAIIKLLDNCDGATIEEKIITIDLNGKTITGTAGDVGSRSSALNIDDNSELEIKGPGKIVSLGYYDDSSELLDSCIENLGKLDLIDVELESEFATCLLNFGSVTIKRSKLLTEYEPCIVDCDAEIEIISGQFSDDEYDYIYDNVSTNSDYYDDGLSPYCYYVNERHFVTYHVDGVTSSPVGPYYIGDTYVINKEVPTKDGYKFDGWNTKEDGSGSTYKESDNIVFQDSNIDLYAVFIIDDDNNDGENHDNSHKIVPNTYTKRIELLYKK